MKNLLRIAQFSFDIYIDFARTPKAFDFERYFLHVILQSSESQQFFSVLPLNMHPEIIFFGSFNLLKVKSVLSSSKSKHLAFRHLYFIRSPSIVFSHF